MTSSSFYRIPDAAKSFCRRSIPALAFALSLATAVLASAAENSAPKMFIAIRDGSVGSEAFATPIDGLRRLNVKAIQLKVDRDFTVRALESNEKLILGSNEDVTAFRRRAEGLGIKICSLNTSIDLSLNDRESNVSWLVRAVEIADLLGASVIRIDPGMSRGNELDFEARVKIVVECLGSVLQKTAGSKVALGIENHGPQGNNLAFLLNVFQQVGSDRLGCTLDLGNFYWRGYPLSEVYGILQILAPYAKHTHVKNIHYPSEKREVMRETGWAYETYYCPLDEGDIDLAKVTAMLSKAGYKGALCIEDESIAKCKTNAERAEVLQRDVAHLRAILDKNP